MPLMHLIVLAVIQGVTEFLPISSSAHLILAPLFLGWQDQGQIVDVAMHVGTLGAVLLYFWRDTLGLLTALVLWPLGRRGFYLRLLGQLTLASLPVFAAGYFMNFYLGGGPRSVEIIAWMTIVFGLVLWLCDRIGLTIRRISHMDWPAALLIGLAQAVALVPGVSRSGITMSAARLLGFERREAARFSMLLSIPTIIGAGVLKGWDLHVSGDLALTQTVLWAALGAFVAALLAIHLLMGWLARATFTPFVIYRLLLGLALLAWLYKPLGWWVF